MSLVQTPPSALQGPLVMMARDDDSSPPATDASPTERFEHLVRTHYTFVWRTSRRLGVRPADLDDAIQEVFLVAARNLDSITYERAYLFRVCVFVASQSRRTARRRREIHDEQHLETALDHAASPEEHVQANEARRTLQGVLDDMPEELRVVFVLHELERFTMSQIADTMSQPAGTVASRLRRAREVFMKLAAARTKDWGNR
ncbi:MAG: sigma-70 family RNA polymerase sigma factor [Myxococcales bacterium]|nr:sigma-70 family RNA polymerase sigma factor [Myxococcales bacterium]